MADNGHGLAEAANVDVELETVAPAPGESGYDAVAAELQETFEDNVILVYPDDHDDDSDDDDGDGPGDQRACSAARLTENGGEGNDTKVSNDSISRQRSKKQRHTSVSKAAFHIFKGNVGVGIFLLPMVYNDAGYLGSPIIGSAVGLLVVDATLMLVRVKPLINNEKVTSYPDLVRYVFGKPLQKSFENKL